jgi:hypothetical protein
MLSRIENDSRINKNNKNYITDFIIFLQTKGTKRATAEKYIYQYKNSSRPFEEAGLLKAVRVTRLAPPSLGTQFSLSSLYGISCPLKILLLQTAELHTGWVDLQESYDRYSTGLLS